MIPTNPIPPVWICQHKYPPAISALLLPCWRYSSPHSRQKQGNRSNPPSLPELNGPRKFHIKRQMDACDENIRTDDFC